MLSFTTRVIISLSGLISAIYFFSVGNWTLGALFLSIPVFQLIGFFLNGTVFLALRKLGANDFEAAERTLRKTKYPQYLAKTQKAYFYMAAGLIEARKNNFQIAAPHLEQALATGLRSKHDKVLVHLNLAGIYYNMNRRDDAAKNVAEAKNNDPAPALQSKIDELEAALARK